MVWHWDFMDSKLTTRDRIIDNARLSFLKNGLLQTSMDDVAKATELHRRTLYRYFKTKEDLAFEVTILFIDDWNKYHKEVYSTLTGKGLSRLTDFLTKLVLYMFERMPVMKFLGEFDFYFSDETENAPSRESFKRFKDIILESDAYISGLIHRGIEDGSINKDVDVDISVATISQVLWGFGQRVAIRGHIIEAETGYKIMDLFIHQINIYTMALKGE